MIIILIILGLVCFLIGRKLANNSYLPDYPTMDCREKACIFGGLAYGFWVSTLIVLIFKIF